MNNEAMFLLIHGARIIDPSQGIDQVGDLLIVEGKIAQVGRAILSGQLSEWTKKKMETLDATGLIVCPGFIDIHCHLREPGFENKETIATGTKAAAIGGFVAVCCMPNTDPPLDNAAVVDWVKRKASKDGVVAVFPIGCITKNRKGEELTDFAELTEAGVVGFSDDGAPVMNSQLMRRALEHSRTLGLPIIDHCEDKALSAGGIINEGRMSDKLRLKGIPAAAEEVMVARDLILAKLTRAKLHIAHVSTKGSMELIRRAKEETIPVTSEVTPHHLTLTETQITSGPPHKSLNPNAKVNPPLRTVEDVNALIEGLKEGVIDAIATDHAPHTSADKNCGLEAAAFGISGFETALGCLLSLVHQGKLSLVQLISKLTHEPAKIIARNNELGTLKIGVPANITLLDPDLEWVVNSHNFVSKGKNTPYEGYRFRGKIMATIANSKLVHIDDSLVIKQSNAAI